MPIVLLRAALAALVACLLLPALAAADASDPDPSFATDGVLDFPDDPSGPQPGVRIEGLPDGGAYVFTRRSGGAPPEAVRVTAAGAVASRVALTPPREDGIEYVAHGVVRHPAGDFTVAAERGGFETLKRRVLVRHTATGEVDTSFGTDGVVFLPERFFFSSEARGTPLLVLPSGAVAVGGWSDDDPSGERRETVVQVTAGGMLDPDFGSSGSASLGVSGVLHDLALDGTRVVAAGASGGHVLVARLDDDGVLDDTFGNGGAVTHAIGDSSAAYAATVGEASAVTVAGVSDVAAEGRSEGMVARLGGDGTPDADFGENGASTSTLEAGEDFGASLHDVVDDGGRVYAVGQATRAAFGGGITFDLVTARFDLSGSLDPSYGGNGIALLPDEDPSRGFTIGEGAALDPDGRLLVTGQSGDRLLVARLQTAASAPVNEEPPAIVDHQEGDFTPGSVLSGSEGRWRAYGEITYAYRWERCDAQTAATGEPTGCAAIAGATGKDHTATDADARKHLRLVVTATREDEDGDALSSRHASATALVEAVRPSNAAPPVVAPSGAVVPGDELTATPGEWEGTQPLTYAYAWVSCRNPDPQPGQCDGGPIPGADSNRYTVGSEDVGRYIGVRVIARNTDSQGNPQSSEAAYSTTRLVKAAEAGAVKPASTSPPTVTPDGPVTEGDTLTGALGSWSGTEPIAYERQWERCAGPAGCEPIAGATAETYVTGPADAGKVVRLLVRASNGAGTSESASSGREVRAKPVPEPTASPTPAPTQAPPGGAVPPPGGGGGDGGGGGGGAPTPPAGKPPVVSDTGFTGRMPDVRGKTAAQAEAAIARELRWVSVEVIAKARRRPRKLDGKKLDAGDVYSQSTAPKAKVRTSQGKPARVKLAVETGRRGIGGCQDKAFRQDLEKLSYETAIELFQAKRCKVDLELRPSGRVEAPRVRDVDRDGRKGIEVTLDVPSDVAEHDLTAWLRGGAVSDEQVGLGVEDWSLTSGVRNTFGVEVIDRGGPKGRSRAVVDAKVFVDGGDVGVEDRVVGTNSAGIAVLGGVVPKKAGTIRLLLQAEDAAGQKIFGFGQVTVVERSGAFVTISGKRFEVGGGTARIAGGPRAKASFAPLVVFGVVVGLIAVTNFANHIKQTAAAAQEPDKVIRNLAPLNAGPALGLLAGPSGGASKVVAPGGANAVAAGGANAVAAGGANVVAAGGANVVAAGGANAIATGGGKAVAIETVRSGTGKLLEVPQLDAGGNLIGPAAGNVIAPGGANVVAAGGANVVLVDAPGLISDNGLGLIGPAAGNWNAPARRPAGAAPPGA